MAYKIYNTEKGKELLIDIARKFGTTPEAIKAINPNMKLIKLFFWEKETVAYDQKIKIPIVMLSAQKK